MEIPKLINYHIANLYNNLLYIIIYPLNFWRIFSLTYTLRPPQFYDFLPTSFGNYLIYFGLLKNIKSKLQNLWDPIFTTNFFNTKNFKFIQFKK